MERRQRDGDRDGNRDEEGGRRERHRRRRRMKEGGGGREGEGGEVEEEEEREKEEEVITCQVKVSVFIFTSMCLQYMMMTCIVRSQCVCVKQLNPFASPFPPLPICRQSISLFPIITLLCCSLTCLYFEFLTQRNRAVRKL